MFKHTIFKIKKYFFIVLITSIFLLTSFSESLSEENIFIIDDVEVEGEVDLNFSRDQYIDKAFLQSFHILISRILLTEDLDKISNIKLKKTRAHTCSVQYLPD